MIACLLLSFTIQSQTATRTNKDTTLCFPIQTVREIEKDLIRGDYCDSTSKAKDTIIDAFKIKIAFKDSTLKAKNEEILLHRMNEGFYNQIGERHEAEINALKKELKKQKFWKVVYKIGDVVLPAAAIYLTYRFTK